MNITARLLTPGLFTTLVILVALATPASAAGDAVKRDLTSVIALKGLPCGQVVNVRQIGENNYVAACSSGHTYRVFLNPNGRVVVQRQ